MKENIHVLVAQNFFMKKYHKQMKMINENRGMKFITAVINSYF